MRPPTGYRGPGTARGTVPPSPRVLLTAALLVAISVPALAPAPAQAATPPWSRGWIALTFDDGPGPSTGQVLDALGSARAPGTFFVLGSQVERRPGTVLRTAQAGHEIANHGSSHLSFRRLSDAALRAELRRTDRAIRATGVTPLPLVRPPYGDRDRRVDQVVAAEGYPVVLWNVDPTDYRATTAQIRARVRAGLRPGAIVLLHDGTAAGGPGPIGSAPTGPSPAASSRASSSARCQRAEARQRGHRPQCSTMPPSIMIS